MEISQEVDLFVKYSTALREAKENESKLLHQINELKAQRDEIVFNYNRSSDNYHLATQLSETYTLDSFDPSLRHHIDCTCYLERNKQLLGEFQKHFKEVQLKIQSKQKLHKKAKRKLVVATLRSEALSIKVETFGPAENS